MSTRVALRHLLPCVSLDCTPTALGRACHLNIRKDYRGSEEQRNGLQQSESYLKFPDAPAGNDDIDPQPAIGAKAKRKQKAAPITATAPSTSIGRGATATTLRESFKNSIQAQFGMSLLQITQKVY